jgi:glutamine amidotransferase
MIHIVDYDAGNQTSVKRALDHLGAASIITSDPEELSRAERIIFPGVGHAHSALETLNERGLDEALKSAGARGIPILGICVGCQILLTGSEETDLPCLDLIGGRCLRFRPEDPALKVPHMGWNELRASHGHPVLRHIRPGDEVYFVHSYYPAPGDARDVLATSRYGVEFAAVIGRENIVATQFHVEKSGPVGLKILGEFARWDGKAC